MNCTICGQPARPGAKLCRHCKAALKRARHETISELQPLRSRSKGEPARRKFSGTRDPAFRTAPTNLDARKSVLPRVAVALAALGATVVAAGYFGDRLLVGENPGTPRMEQRQHAPGPNAEAGPTVEAVAPAMMPVPETSPSAWGDRPPAAPAVGKGAPKGLASPFQAATGDAVSGFGPAEEAPQMPPAPVPAEPVREAPDRWQAMADAIARCRGEGLLARVMCEQRARLAACEGNWGQVEQCPSGRKADYGQ